jgi:hypothetical protein
MSNTFKLLKKEAVIMFFFFICFLMTHAGLAQDNGDKLTRAEGLYEKEEYPASIELLDEFITQDGTFFGQEKRLVEAFYLLAKNWFRMGNDKKFEEYLKKVYKTYPGFSKEEIDRDFKDRVEHIKRKIAASNTAFHNSDISKKGIFITFIVDVSPSLGPLKKLITDYVEGVIESLERENIRKKEYRLITFCDKANYFKPNRNLDKDDITDEINDEIEKRIGKAKLKTYPLYAFIKSFELIKKNFTREVGIVIFISDGEDNRTKRYESKRAHDDLRQVIIGIKKTGFTVYSVYIKTGNTPSCEPCMKTIAGWAGTSLIKINAGSNLTEEISNLKKQIIGSRFISPVPRKKHTEREEQLLAANRIKEKEMEPLKLKNKKYKRDIVLLAIIGVMLLSVLIMGVFWVWRGQKIKKKELKARIPELNILWGKIKFRGKDGEIIDLSKKTKSFKFSPPFNYPEIEFFTEKREGKKAIIILCKNGRVKFYTKENKEIYIDYIDEQTCSFKIYKKYSKKPLVYDYNFLNKLEKSCHNPVWENGEFLGREQVVGEIKDNFLNLKEIYHFLISGMGNAGKTSLMNYIYHIGLGEDEQVKEKYSLALIEFKTEAYAAFADVERKITNQLLPGGEKKNLIIIDEYDQLLEAFPDEFGAFVKERTNDYKNFFIFTGRKGASLVEQDFLPPYMYFKNLEGLDYAESIAEEDYFTSFKLLESLILDLGIPGNVLGEDVKRQIVTYASGFPSLIKQILYELLRKWITHFDNPAVTLEGVETAVKEIKENAKGFLLQRACDIDESRHEEPIAGEVRIREILNRLSEGYRGTAPTEALKADLTMYQEDDIVEKRSVSFDEKILQLKEMGFIKEYDGNFIGIPHMFFYKGEKVIANR